MSRVPLSGSPGASSPIGKRRKVTRILSPAHRHYEITATIGLCQRERHSWRPVLDTGAAFNLVRPNVLFANWQSYADKLERTPRIRDANNNRLIAHYAIHLCMDVGCAKVFDRFFVAEHLSVPCILGTEFMDNHVEAIFTRLRNVVWHDHVGDVTSTAVALSWTLGPALTWFDLMSYPPTGRVMLRSSSAHPASEMQTSTVS